MRASSRASAATRPSGDQPGLRRRLSDGGVFHAAPISVRVAPPVAMAARQPDFVEPAAAFVRPIRKSLSTSSPRRPQPSRDLSPLPPP